MSAETTQRVPYFAGSNATQAMIIVDGKPVEVTARQAAASLELLEACKRALLVLEVTYTVPTSERAALVSQAAFDADVNVQQLRAAIKKAGA